MISRYKRLSNLSYEVPSYPVSFFPWFAIEFVSTFRTYLLALALVRNQLNRLRARGREG